MSHGPPPPEWLVESAGAAAAKLRAAGEPVNADTLRDADVGLSLYRAMDAVLWALEYAAAEADERERS